MDLFNTNEITVVDVIECINKDNKKSNPTEFKIDTFSPGSLNLSNYLKSETKDGFYFGKKVTITIKIIKFTHTVLIRHIINVMIK